MKREEFYEYVKDNIMDFLPEHLRNGTPVLGKTVKNNSEGTGITIRPGSEAGNISPVIYLDGMYDIMEKESVGLNEIMREIARIYTEHFVQTFDPEAVTNYQRIKDNIFPRLVAIEGNDKFLSDLVYRPVEDMALLYYINMENVLGSNSRSSAIITKSLFEYYGVSEEDIYKQAITNQKDAGYDLISMSEIMDRLIAMGAIPPYAMEYDVPMYILSNKEHHQGAAMIADTGILSEVAKKQGWDEFFIIPSSVHEVILLPDTSVDPEYLKKMVCEVNGDGEVLSPQDKLSDSVYFFDAKNCELSVAGSDMEESLD